jgi:predicted nuclease with TOPRIM domain
MIGKMLALLLENEQLRTIASDLRILVRGLADEASNLRSSLQQTTDRLDKVRRINARLIDENNELRLQRDNMAGDLRNALIGQSKLRGHYNDAMAQVMRLKRYKTVVIAGLYSGGEVLSLRSTVRELRGKLDATLQAHANQRETIEQLESHLKQEKARTERLREQLDAQSGKVREAVSKLGGITIADLLPKNPVILGVDMGYHPSVSVGYRVPRYETKSPTGINSKE